MTGQEIMNSRRSTSQSYTYAPYDRIAMGSDTPCGGSSKICYDMADGRVCQ